MFHLQNFKLKQKMLISINNFSIWTFKSCDFLLYFWLTCKNVCQLVHLFAHCCPLFYIFVTPATDYKSFYFTLNFQLQKQICMSIRPFVSCQSPSESLLLVDTPISDLDHWPSCSSGLWAVIASNHTNQPSCTTPTARSKPCVPCSVLTTLVPVVDSFWTCYLWSNMLVAAQI